ncbi:MAG TPA: hypothetical protein PK299_05060 [Anaerolineales bacterium]|nr:hypothetical protein [Anaerolineales bacterium]
MNTPLSYPQPVRNALYALQMQSFADQIWQPGSPLALLTAQMLWASIPLVQGWLEPQPWLTWAQQLSQPGDTTHHAND